MEPVQLWPRHALDVWSSNLQAWYYDIDTNQLTLQNKPQLCLDDGNGLENGVILWDCDTTGTNWNQKWWFYLESCGGDYKLTNWNQGQEVCLDVPDYNFNDDTQLITYGCTGCNGLNQMWSTEFPLP